MYKMRAVATIIYILFNIYAIGLVVYIVCSWLDNPSVQNFKNNLGRGYKPFLDSIQRVIRPVRFGDSYIDFAPIILLIIIYLLRWVITSLLIIPF